ncbi:hypothetical protein [Psychrobacillus sp. L3]|uniref:hypothetical protein n=1 Tax=Psychrobacillus sp. L3 TaxID=3236891 RepID=UPI0036F2244D
MKKLNLSVYFIILLLLVGCSQEKEPPTVEERNAYLDSIEYIDQYEDGDDRKSTLNITMAEEFAELKVSEQYLFLKEFFDTYEKTYGEVFGYVNRFDELYVRFHDKDYTTYSVYDRAFYLTSTGDHFETKDLQDNETLLDDYDKNVVFNGTFKGKTAEESRAESSAKYTGSTSNSDTETYIKDKNGHDWIQLTDNQRFHAISNALYSLDQNGFVIEESEYYYIDALNAFYSDNSTRNTPINEALVSVGLMSGTIYK